jgi:hypothetical protein
MGKLSKRATDFAFMLFEKLSERSKNILIVLSVILFCAIPLFKFADNTLGDRTMANCTASSPQSAIHGWARLPIETSCGPVYIYGHLKNSFGAHPYAALEMRKALASGKPVTIKATGITGMLMAYEITPTE